MRIVVFGATGNLGTALLERLGGTDHSVIGVARRRPDTRTAPYDGADWETADVGDPASAARLRSIVAGADAVVDLAWALQPNRDQRALERTNVHGLRHVLAALDGVPRFVWASSVGAYSLGPKHRRVDESWPTGGVHSSHYARHKAMAERALDTFEQQHPDTAVVRIRPGLVFQDAAATEIARLFLGWWIPTRWVGRVPLPVLPVSNRLVSQVVHARDVADAIVRALERDARGAFNLAAEPPVGPDQIAAAIGAGRAVPMRFAVLRALVASSWALHAQNTDPGWLDLSEAVPLMSTERARRELDWQPTVGSTEALAIIVRGLQKRSTHRGSPPLG
ncbi:NAD-dependent epimerase/dehydratase family protein [Microbacteriaceae bacterium VKM Ac-2855]|nr:NAD-dependent epimerase/dehydratase family protein [Microbacteriaceae bacterium VKM Ac-2855]